MSLRRSTQITSQRLSFSQGIEDSLLYSGSVVVEAHVSQHHDGGEEESGGVGERLAGDIWGGTVNGFEDRAFVSDVAGWSEAETTDETSAHIGENVTVQVRHDEDLVIVWCWVGNDLQAGVVEKLGVELDAGVILGYSLGGAEEETVGHLHDGGLVYGADL